MTKLVNGLQSNKLQPFHPDRNLHEIHMVCHHFTQTEIHMIIHMVFKVFNNLTGTCILEEHIYFDFAIYSLISVQIL